MNRKLAYAHYHIIFKYRTDININDIFNFFFFLERLEILYFKKILQNFFKRIYLKYENILRKNGKYFILFILRKFGQIMTNILRKLLRILKKLYEKKRKDCINF